MRSSKRLVQRHVASLHRPLGFVAREASVKVCDIPKLDGLTVGELGDLSECGSIFGRFRLFNIAQIQEQSIGLYPRLRRTSGSFDPRQIDAEILQAALFPADWLPKPRRHALMPLNSTRHAYCVNYRRFFVSGWSCCM